MNNDMKYTHMNEQEIQEQQNLDEGGQRQLQIEHEEHKKQEEHQLSAVDLAIIKERNTEIKAIAHDVSIISEIFHTIQNMVLDQGLDLNVAYEHVERAEINTTEAKESLEKAEQYHAHSTRNIRDTSIVVTGLAIGGVGWIGGPWIGIPTTAVGVGISTGIVMLLRKIGV